MFVRTEDDKIVNLERFEGIRIDETIGIYGLNAFTEYVEGQTPREISLVTFDKGEHAIMALESLFETIRKGEKHAWDAKTFKRDIGAEHIHISASVQRVIP